MPGFIHSFINKYGPVFIIGGIDLFPEVYGSCPLLILIHGIVQIKTPLTTRPVGSEHQGMFKDKGTFVIGITGQDLIQIKVLKFGIKKLPKE